MLTYNQAAVALGVSLSTVRNMVERRELVAIRPAGHVVRIPLTEIEAWIARKVAEAKQTSQAAATTAA